MRKPGLSCLDQRVPRPSWGFGSAMAFAFTVAFSLHLLLAAPASAQYFGQNKVQYRERDWSVATTPHFRVHFHDGERDAAMDACRMAERAYARLSTILDHEIDQPIPLILYASQAEFQQTNVSGGMIGEGTGGFTEYLKGRVALPLTGSYRDLDHVLTHELVHAFQVDLLFGGKSSVSNPFQFVPPLWLMEGMAEYLSLHEIDPLTEMWLRDGALEGYLTPLPVLDYVGDIRVYRYGQSVIGYLARTFGDEAVGQVFKKVAATRSVSRGFEDALGITLEKFGENWLEDVRKTYLPTIRDHEKPEAFAFRLTEAERELADVHLAPALSPDGDRMVYFSDPSLYNDLYLASAIDGQVERRLVKGERHGNFESLRYFTSSLDWSPDGTRIAFAARADGRDALYLQRVEDGEIVEKLTPPLDGLSFPSWSPDGEWLVFSGLLGGRSNLYRIRQDGSGFEALTQGRHMAQEPRFTPDGGRVVFVTDRGAETDFENLLFDLPKIAFLDLTTRVVTVMPDQPGRNISPHVFPDGRHLVFISDRSGIANLYLRDLESGEDRRITDLLTGVTGIVPNGSAVTLARSGKRLVFSAYSRGTWDLFAIKDPVERWADGTPWSELARQTVDPASEPLTEPTTVATESPSAPVAADSSSVAATDSLATADFPSELPAELPAEPPPEAPPVASSARLDSLWQEVQALGPAVGDSSAATDEIEEETVDIAQVFRSTRALPEDADYEVDDYRPHFSADFVGANGFFSSDIGLAAQSALRFSDILGNQVIVVGAYVYGSLEDSDLLLEYINLKQRTNWGVSVFQFRNDYYLLTPDSPDRYTSRVYRGANLTLQRPFDRFRRLEWSVSAQRVEEDLLQRQIGTSQYARSNFAGPWYYVQPGLAFVHDNTLYGYTGPISGARSRLSIEAGLGELSYTTYLADARRYLNLRHQYTFAFRTIAASSHGRDPQLFQVGGPYTLRGYDWGEFRGSTILLGGAEFRFPLIEQLRLGWPLPLSLSGLRGALFFDLGGAIEEGESFQAFSTEGGRLRMEDLHGSYGLSAGLNVGFTILKWDLSWKTNLARSSKQPRGYLSFGLDF